MRARSVARLVLVAGALCVGATARAEGRTDPRTDGRTDGGAGPADGRTDGSAARKAGVPRKKSPALAPGFSPAPAPVPLDDCDRDPGCRLWRFRRRLEHQRRLDYLKAVEAQALEMDRSFEHRRPYRDRFPFGVDLLVISNLALPGVVVSYTPTFWIRFEVFLGNMTENSYQYDNQSSRQISISALSYGAQARVLPVKFALSPYAGFGLAAINGHVVGSYYDNTGSGLGGSTDGNGSAVLITLGLGLELTLPYFHVAVGYQLSQPFYTQGSTNQMHDDAVRLGFAAVLNGNPHGVNAEIGCVF